MLFIFVKNSSQKTNGLHFPQNEYHVSIVENTTLATPQQLIVLSANGAESADVLSYSILNPHPEFEISSGSGQISWLGGAVDREATPQIKLLVQVMFLVPTHSST